MKGRIFLGDFPALEAKLLEEIAARAGSHPLAPRVVVVPTGLLAEHLKKALAGRGGAAGVRFFTLAGLAEALAEDALLRQGLRPLPAGGEEILAGAALARSPAPAPGQAPLPGMAAAAARTLADLREGGLAPGHLERARGRLGGGLGKKLGEMSRLLAEYARLLREGSFYDTPDLLEEAARRAPSSPLLREASFVAAYGFYDLNALQRRLLRASLRAAPRAGVFFPWEGAERGQSRPGGEVPLALSYANQLKEWFLRLGLEPVPLPGEGPFREVRRRLFGWGRYGVLRVPRLALVAAPGEAREAYEIGREAWRLAEEEGVRFEEMAVLLRPEDPYGRLLRETFDSLEIPYRFVGGPPLAEGRVARRFRLFLDLKSSGMRRRDVLSFFALSPEGLEVSTWERLTREAGIAGGEEAWGKGLGRLARRAERAEEDSERRAIGELRRRAEALFQALAAIPERGSPAALTRASLTAFERLEPDCRAIEERLRAWESLELPELSLEEFARWAGKLLEKTPAPESAPRRGVTIARLMDARGASFRAVLLPGLGAGQFPSAGRQDPLLPDEARKALDGDSADGLPLLPRQEGRWEEERLLFWLALGAAREHLVLSYPSRDPLQGRKKLPSLFLLHLASALGAPMTEEGLKKLPGWRQASGALEVSDKVRAASRQEEDQRLIHGALAKGRESPGALVPFIEESGSLRRAFEAERERWENPYFTPFDGLLAGERAREALRAWLGDPPRPLSPTALETYYVCPFQHFLGEVLGLEEAEEPEELYGLPPDRRGRLYHSILTRFFKRCATEGLLPLARERREGLLSLLREAAEDAFREQEEGGFTGYPLVWRRTKEEVWEDLCDLLDREIGDPEGFVPSAFEETIEVPLPEVGLSLKGRVDRLDRSGKRLRVIDYKTGKHRGEKDDSLAWTTELFGPPLQAPLYLLAAGRRYPEAEAESATLYFLTRRGGRKPISFSASALEKNRSLLLRFLRAAAEGWREGRFFPYPLEGACKGCDFRAVCGAAIGEQVARKEGTDPYLRAFEELRGEAKG